MPCLNPDGGRGATTVWDPCFDAIAATLAIRAQSKDARGDDQNRQWPPPSPSRASTRRKRPCKLKQGVVEIGCLFS